MINNIVENTTSNEGWNSTDNQQVIVPFNCDPLSLGQDEGVTILHFVPTDETTHYDPQQALRDINQIQFLNEGCEHPFKQYGVYRCTLRIEYIKSSDYFSTGDDVDEIYHFEKEQLLVAFEGESKGVCYSCVDCEWEGESHECDTDTEPDEFNGRDKTYPICPKCGGALDC